MQPELAFLANRIKQLRLAKKISQEDLAAKAGLSRTGMGLIEQGKLSVDDPVAKHIPAFAGQKLKDGSPARPVTIRDVLTHTAGLATSRGQSVTVGARRDEK